jgi:hypothetical protein
MLPMSFNGLFMKARGAKVTNDFIDRLGKQLLGNVLAFI